MALLAKRHKGRLRAEVPKTQTSTKRAITKAPIRSSVSSTASSKPKRRQASLAKPVRRAPIRNTRSSSSSSMSKVTKKSPIGNASTGRVVRRTVNVGNR